MISAVRLDRLSFKNVKGARRLAGEVSGDEEPDLDAPFGRHLSLSFEAFDKKYQVELSLHDALFAKGAVTRGYDEKGNEIVRRPRAVAYHGRFPGGGWIRAAVHSDDIVHATWYENGEVNMLIPVSKYDSRAPHVAKHARDQGGQMLAFHLHDIPHDDDNRHLLDSWLGREGWNRAERQQEIHPVGEGQGEKVGSQQPEEHQVSAGKDQCEKQSHIKNFYLSFLLFLIHSSISIIITYAQVGRPRNKRESSRWPQC